MALVNILYKRTRFLLFFCPLTSCAFLYLFWCFSASAWRASLLLFKIAFDKPLGIWEGRNRCLWPFTFFSLPLLQCSSFNLRSWGFVFFMSLQLQKHKTATTIYLLTESFKPFFSTSLQSFLMRRKMCLHQSKIFRFSPKVGITYTRKIQSGSVTNMTLWWQQ